MKWPYRAPTFVDVTMTLMPRRPLVEPSIAPLTRRPRVALYGHDTMGLGHLRRNLTLAAAISALPCEPNVLVISGAAEAGRFPRIPRVDLLTVPGVVKGEDGMYAAEHWDADLDELVRMRSALMSTALTSWAPDLLIVDKVPLGFHGELEQSLQALRRRGGTRVVLGLRDVLDTPTVARSEWRAGRCNEAVREHYDEVWVYGDRAVRDLAEDCSFPPAVRAKTRHLGYLSIGRLGEPATPPGTNGRPYVLGLVGGGQDGGELAAAFARTPMPAGVTGVLLTGPYLPERDRWVVEAAAAQRDDLVVVPFADEAERWLARASAVIAMGGCNTVCEILATDVPALLVPRVSPRAEQLVRAESLSDLGAVDVLLPDDLDAEQLRSWIAAAVDGPRVDRGGLDLDGVRAVAASAQVLLGEHMAMGVSRVAG